MKFKRAQILSGCAIFATAAILFYGAIAGSAAKPNRLSDILNPSEPYSVMALLPDVPAFITKLRSGAEMRSFFDSPLGLHFLKSAPLRGAAHLHRLISYAPESWQWNLYTTISDGPIVYRSHGQKFVLAIALNRKGQLATSLVGHPSAQKVGDWFIIASDKNELNKQVEYMKKPIVADLPLDQTLAQAGTMGIDVQFAAANSTKRSLFRNLLSEIFSSQDLTRCTIALTPGANSIQLNGDCQPRDSGTLANTPGLDETLTVADYPAYVYYRKPGQKVSYLLSLNGFATDYGHLIPQMLFSGPSGDQKTMEFLSQAFKTKAHQIESNGNAILIRYPSAYRYEKRKFDVFAPHLTANQERFFWQSFLPEKKVTETKLSISGKYGFYAKIDLHSLIRNSQAAIKQYDAIYSPAHFNEFRDALAKSTSYLKNSSLRLYSQANNKSLRVGGTLGFAEN